jgi:hypothetical protein
MAAGPPNIILILPRKKQVPSRIELKAYVP